MKFLLVPILALSVGTAAFAAPPSANISGSYPACSKMVKDECTEGGAGAAKAVTGTKHAHKIAHHRHHRAVGKSG